MAHLQLDSVAWLQGCCLRLERAFTRTHLISQRQPPLQERPGQRAAGSTDVLQVTVHKCSGGVEVGWHLVCLRLVRGPLGVRRRRRVNCTLRCQPSFACCCISDALSDLSRPRLLDLPAAGEGSLLGHEADLCSAVRLKLLLCGGQHSMPERWYIVTWLQKVLHRLHHEKEEQLSTATWKSHLPCKLLHGGVRLPVPDTAQPAWGATGETGWSCYHVQLARWRPSCAAQPLCLTKMPF